MSLRIFRRVRLVPGVTLNVSKSGASLSLGVRGAHVTVGRSGVRRTVGLPGSGVFYTSCSGHHSGAHSNEAFHDGAWQPPLWIRVIVGTAGLAGALLLIGEAWILFEAFIRAEVGP